MAEQQQAHVASIEALEDFRGALLRYRQRATQALDDVSGEVKRMREWLSYEKRMAWEGEVKRCRRRLDQAEAELVTAKFSALKDDHSVQQLAVKKARRALEEAEEKLRVTRKWARDFDSMVEPASRPLDGLRERLADQFPKAVGSLDGMIRTLGEYAASRAGGSKPVRVEAQVPRENNDRDGHATGGESETE